MLENSKTEGIIQVLSLTPEVSPLIFPHGRKEVNKGGRHAS